MTKVATDVASVAKNGYLLIDGIALQLVRDAIIVEWKTVSPG